ncbi:MAG: carboxymuconolactone decarboxylase family protein [Sphingomonadales bacterium]
MARVPYLDKQDLPAEYQELLNRSINVTRALAHSPRAARRFGALGNYIRNGSTLDSRLSEMAIIQVGYLTRSPYEYSHHVKIGMDMGVSEDDIRAIADETAGKTTGLDPLAKAAIRAAREMTTDLTVSDDTFALLLGELGTERLVDLILAIATYNGVVRILGALQIDVEDDYQVYLEKFPLPMA